MFRALLVVFAACGGTRDPAECLFGQSSEACEPTGRVSKEDRRETAERRTRAEAACRQQHDAVACHDAGVGSNLDQALPLYEESCRLGHAPGCTAMGGITHGFETRVASWRPRVIAALHRGCHQLAAAPSCRGLFEYLRRQPSPGDDAQIALAVATACELVTTDHAICLEAGVRYWSGRGVPADRERGRAYLVKACQGEGAPDRHSEEACAALGRIEVGQPPAKESP